MIDSYIANIEAVVVIGVDIMENESLVSQYVEEGGFHRIFVLDTTGAVSNDYAITATPTSFFPDKENVIRAAQMGVTTKRDMKAQLARAMRRKRQVKEQTN